jgi:hypothetical protein
VGDGEADSLGEGDASAFFLVVFFAAGDASAEVEVDVFLVVELFFVVEAPWVVVAVEVVAASSFFWDWQPTNAAIATAVIKVKTNVFIWSWLSWTNARMSILPSQSKHENLCFFAFLISFFSPVISP